MKKKAQSPKAILARAEKMFAKENFQAAKNGTRKK